MKIRKSFLVPSDVETSGDLIGTPHKLPDGTNRVSLIILDRIFPGDWITINLNFSYEKHVDIDQTETTREFTLPVKVSILGEQGESTKDFKILQKISFQNQNT